MLIKSKFDEIVNILVSYFDSNLNKSALHFCLSVISKIEFEHRPKEYTNAYYQSGIETTDFLFDIINYLSGYHELNCYLNVRIYSQFFFYPNFMVIFFSIFFTLILGSFFLKGSTQIISFRSVSEV